MITGEGITYQLDEKETKSCEDFSFKGGVRYLPYAQKDVFSALSLSSVPFASGSLSVDGVSLAPAGFTGGTAKVIKLDVKDTGSLTLVMFYPGSEGEAERSFSKLAAQLRALKFPAKDEQDKKDKLVMLKTVLSLNSISYILIDLNDPLTRENRALWERVLSDYEGAVFFLSEDLEKAKDEKIPLLITSRSAMALPC